MKRGLAVLLAAVTVAALAGCSVSFGDGVTVVGPGPSYAPGNGPGAVQELPERTATSDPRTLVQNFLQSIASDPADRDSALEHARSFIAPSERTAWKPSAEINVVRILDLTSTVQDNDFRVNLEVQHLGVLTQHGRLDRPLSSKTSYVFEVGAAPNQSGRFLVKAPPTDLLLSDVGLHTYFEQRPIYFWNAEGTSLLPDVRYLARALREAPETRLVDWLLEGPAPWLEEVAKQLPQTKREGPVARDSDGRLVVNLSQPTGSSAPDLEKLAQQLAWTIEPRTVTRSMSSLILQIEGVTQSTGGEYLSANVATEQERSTPLRYGISDGVLYRLKRSDDSDDEARRPLGLDPKRNTRLVAAAVSVQVDRDALELDRQIDERAFALVRLDPETGRQRLWIGPTANVRETSLEGQRISQPVWLDHEASAVIVLMDGQLYYVSVKGVAEKIDMPVSSITAFTVAPDGHRIAVVSDGKLFVAGLRRGGDAPSVNSPMRLVPTPLKDLQAVAFSREDSLALAGSDGDKVRLAEITVDGAVQWPLRSEFPANTQITHMVAYTDYPADGTHQGQVMIELSGQSYDAYTTPQSLASSLILPTPSPSASPGPDESTIKVTAPSFQG